MSLPDVSLIREKINSIKRHDMRYALMFAYVAGARIREVCGKVTKADSHPELIYGPTGLDVEVKKYNPQIPETFKAIQLIYPQSKTQIIQMYKTIEVAVFTVSIAKRHLEPEEKIHKRKIALPLDPTYEPYTKPLLEYFQFRGAKRVFPFSRQDVWFWISHKEPVFKGLHYPIIKYTYKPKDKKPVKVLGHIRDFKLHALRHLRLTELRRDYNFDGLQLAAFAGWSMTHAAGQTRQNEKYSPQTQTYFPLYEEWQSYLPKLLISKQSN